MLELNGAYEGHGVVINPFHNGFLPKLFSVLHILFDIDTNGIHNRLLKTSGPSTSLFSTRHLILTCLSLCSGLKEKCVDSLVFETLIPKPMMQHYISLLLKHRRLVLSGPSGTGKSYLASRLAEYLVDRSAREVTNGIVVTFNMHRQSCKVTEADFLWESLNRVLLGL